MSRPLDATDLRLARYGRCLHVAGLVIAVVLFAVVYVPALGALWHTETRITGQIDAATRLLDSADALREEHGKLLERQAETQIRTAQLMARIPDAPQESEFLAHIARLAQQSSLSIRNFRPVATRARDRDSEVEVHLSAEGRYEGLCRFLAGLETLPRLCSVTRLSVVNEKPASGTLPVEITFVIYFAPRTAGPADRDRRTP